MIETPLPHDPALPHLSTALDAGAMARVFGDLLTGQGGAQVQTCRIDRIKYRPRRNCSVSYVLSLRDERSACTFEQPVSTRWCSGGDAAHRHGKAAQGASHASAAGPALSHLPQLDMLASWLPNDPKLGALAEMVDDDRLRTRWLPEVVAALTQGRGRLIAHRKTLVQWVPEHRACARVELQVAQGSEVQAHTVYAKADTEHSGADTHAVMQTLQASGRVRSARPILWQPESGLHWQQAVEGRPLAEFGSGITLRHAAQVGRLVAALHATPLPTPRRLTLDDLKRQRHDAAAMLGLVEPQWQPLLDRLVRALDRQAQALPPPAHATLHGDLHRVNVLATQRGLALIDLDGVLQGPAVIELGAWIADSIYLALLEGQAAGASTPQWRAMLRAYGEAGGPPAPLDEVQLAWACAHQLLCQRAYRCVVNLKPGRLALVPALLQTAEAILREGTAEAVA